MAPNTVLPGETISVSLIATNYSSTPLQDVEIGARVPTDLVTIDSISEGGSLIGDQLTWTISEIGADGARASVTFQLSVLGEDGHIPIDIQAYIPGE